MSTSWTVRLDNPLSARLRDAAITGYLGIFLGAFAAFLAIPPIEARTITWPILVGIVAMLLGVWTIARGRRRLGWGACAAGLVGIGLGILATYSSTDNLNQAFDATLVAQTFGLATPLIFGAMAGIFASQMRGARGVDHPTVRDAGHFLQEDAGEELAEAIVRFLQQPG